MVIGPPQGLTFVGWYVWPGFDGREVTGFLVWGEQVGRLEEGACRTTEVGSFAAMAVARRSSAAMRKTIIFAAGTLVDACCLSVVLNRPNGELL